MRKISLAFAVGLGLGALAGCAEADCFIAPPMFTFCSDEFGIYHLWHVDLDGDPLLIWPEPFLIPGTDTPLEP